MNDSIVIVEDDADFRALLRRNLEKAGFNVVAEASDGDEAVELAEKINPALILMDMNLGKMNGLDATRKIKEKNKSVTVIILTGAPSPSLVYECKEVGAENFVMKSSEPERLMRLVRRALDDS